MKSISCLFILILSLTFSNLSLSGGHGYHCKSKPDINRLAKKLKLDDKQREAIKPILEQRKEQYELIREESMKRKEAVQDETTQKLSEILNDEQLAKYSKMLEKRKARKEKRKAERHERCKKKKSVTY